MKKLILATFLCFCGIGCTTTHHECNQMSSQTYSVNSFNNKTYVWESWNTTTNTVNPIIIK